jgi:hypothetical protein
MHGQENIKFPEYLLGWKVFQTEFVEVKTLFTKRISKSHTSFEKHKQKLQNKSELLHCVMCPNVFEMVVEDIRK